MKHLLLKSMMLVLMLFVGMGAWADVTATYTVTSTTAVSATNAPRGSSANYTQDYNTTSQMTEAKPNAALTLSGYDGLQIKGIKLNLKNSNSKKVTVTVKVGTTTIVNATQISLSTTATDKTLTLSSAPVVGDGEKVSITMKANGSSVWFYNAKITYDEVTPITVNLSKNGVISQEQLYPPYTLPAAADLSETWKFKGWAAAPVSNTTTKPTYVSKAVADDDTFYAVYAKVTGGSGNNGFEKISTVAGIVPGTYAIAVNKVDVNKYNFANATSADGHAGVEGTGVAKEDSYNEGDLPSGAVLYELEGNNTDGFSIKELSTNTYLIGGSAKASLSYSASAAETWVFSLDDNDGFNLTGKTNGSKMSVNSTTAASAIRNYASTGAFYDGIFFFLYTETGTTTYDSTPAVTINVTTPEGYSTFYCEDAVELPEGVDGSTATVTDGKLTLAWEYKAGDVVPAGTPILVKGTQGAHTATITTGGDAPATNYLVANTTNAVEEAWYLADDDNFESKYYVLSYDKAGNNLGFYWLTEDGNGEFDVPVGNVFLHVPASMASNAPAFRFSDDDETAIENVKTSGTDTGILYNLQGLRVNANAKGIVIKNGKKYFVK